MWRAGGWAFPKYVPDINVGNMGVSKDRGMVRSGQRFKRICPFRAQEGVKSGRYGITGSESSVGGQETI